MKRYWLLLIFSGLLWMVACQTMGSEQTAVSLLTPTPSSTPPEPTATAQPTETAVAPQSTETAVPIPPTEAPPPDTNPMVVEFFSVY